MMDLSVVLISKNQAWNTSRLIESVLQGTTGIASKEIILVDSASTDGTLAVARRYPVTVLRLLPDQQLTPSKGRYVGYMQSSGKHVLFLDGDMALCGGWVERGLAVLRDKLDVAAVTGLVMDCPLTASCNGRTIQHQSEASDTCVEVLHPGGAAMFQRAALDEVGTYNPYLYSDEEPELCVRLQHAGYRVLRVGHPIAYHYSEPHDAIGTLIHRWRRNLYLGIGQSMRFHLGTALFWPYVRKRGHGCAPALTLTLGIGSLVYAVRMQRWLWFELWGSAVGLMLLGDAYRKRSVYRVAYSLVKRLFIVDGMVRGFLLKPQYPDRDPVRFEVIQQHRER